MMIFSGSLGRRATAGPSLDQNGASRPGLQARKDNSTISPWLQSLRDLDKAFRNWWACPRDKRKGKVRAPRFKRRSTSQGIRFIRGGFRVEGQALRLSKVGAIPITWSRELPSAPSSVPILKDCAGRHFASFGVEVERPSKVPSLSVGADQEIATESEPEGKELQQSAKGPAAGYAGRPERGRDGQEPHAGPRHSRRRVATAQDSPGVQGNVSNLLSLRH